MKFTTMKQAAQFRITENEDDYWIEDYWKAAIEIFTKDCAKTIKFFQKDCTYEEFYWVSEIFEEIAEKTQSKELISTWRSRLTVVRPESYCKQNFHSKEMQHVDYSEYVRSIE